MVLEIQLNSSFVSNAESSKDYLDNLVMTIQNHVRIIRHCHSHKLYCALGYVKFVHIQAKTKSLNRKSTKTQRGLRETLAFFTNKEREKDCMSVCLLST